MTIPKTWLTLQQLELELFVGHYAAERETKQKIWVDIELIFASPPLACTTDQLENTFCYQALTKQLQDKLTSDVFHLIEYLAFRIYDLIKNLCGPNVSVSVEVTKKPQLSLPNAGTRFKYGDH